ncbi:hypothetical protein QBC46DRAFT_378444 [Diplogelasinospora grovesii]|uniref:Uncharacterized protein n=1 Tax=Diplogelasinospora grovesii TaxID=303347 RepID=A0AAN6NCC6_9PEZI|nr:hypothetical protein QBC46DRAFT_378444 [Diplogelasinospora grovesii]
MARFRSPMKFLCLSVYPFSHLALCFCAPDWFLSQPTSLFEFDFSSTCECYVYLAACLYIWFISLCFLM